MEGGTKIMQLRVMISPNNARRIDLPSRPESVEELKAILQNQLELRDGFRLQYEDALFGNSLCNLHHINELPDGKAVLKVIWDDELTLEIIPAPSDAGSLSFDPASPSSSTSSIMTSPNTSQHLRDATHWPSLDTASPSSSTSSIMTSPNTSKHLRVTTHWPSSFDVPKFSIDVELRLKKANDSYSQTKVPLVVPRDMKSEILSKLVQALFEIRPYPSRDEVETAVIALVQKHPCLAEEKPSSGWDAWLSSLWFKVGNYRYKLRQAGMPEVAINRKRHGEDGVTKFNLKKSRRAEVNFVPDHPEGQTKETLEEERLEMIEEMKKKNVDTSLVQQKMHSTFSLRRREIVEVQPLVQEIKERWPAMFLTDEICREFHRITNVHLMATFQSALEKFAPALLKLYRSKKESEFRALLAPLDEEVTAIAEQRRRVALEGLPLFLKEDPSNLFKTCLDTDEEQDYTKGVKIGIMMMYEDAVCAVASLPAVSNICIILEECVIIQDIKDLPSATAYLFGLLYCINMEYPTTLRYSFEVIQKLFLGMGANCLSARAQSLRAKMQTCLR